MLVVIVVRDARVERTESGVGGRGRETEAIAMDGRSNVKVGEMKSKCRMS